MSKLNIIIAFLALCLGLASCGTGTSRPDMAEPASKLESTALSLLQQGAYREAAAEYLQLAEQYPEQAIQYRLKAATAYYQAGDIENTRQILDNTTVDAAAMPIQALQKNIVLAKIALGAGQTETALSLLSAKPSTDIPAAIRIARHETRAQAFDQLEDSANAVDQRLMAYAISDSNNESNIDYHSLWRGLQRLDTEQLQTLLGTLKSQSASWVELALLDKTYRGRPEALQQQLTNWQDRHPNHLANLEIVPQLLNTSTRLTAVPQSIALLLPLSGKFQQASQAVREGFMAGWLQQTIDRPMIRVYDTASSDITQVYQQAMEDGAEFIVGPLQKDNIERLVNNRSIATHTLALNYLDSSQQANPTDTPNTLLFQFGLSPEQEAAQIAKRALADGHLRALVIVPESDWGERLHLAFKSQFEQLGGRVLEHSYYHPPEEDFNLAVQSLLNTDISKQRAKRLVERLKLNIQSETRRRQDVDMIFIGAKNQHAKQITPLLYFERAGKVPKYATSSVFVLGGTAETYTDMNNILFTDIPWLLSNDSRFQRSKSALQRYWPNANTTTHRLYAMGLDAYTVLNQFPQLSSDPKFVIRGATGVLNMDDYGRIRRKMSWGKLLNGKPELLQEIVSQTYKP